MRAALLALLLLVGMARAGPADFEPPRSVAIEGHDDHAMEPFLSRDGQWLFFNTRNGPRDRTDILLARRIDDHRYALVGPLPGANSPALDGVPSLDRHGRFVFVSPRDYDATRNTLWQGRFAAGVLHEVMPLPGTVQRRAVPWINMDAEISADGETLYYTENRWRVLGGGVESSDILVARRDVGGAFHPLPEAAALLRTVNSPLLEFAPATTADERTLYFTRADPRAIARGRPDGFGIFVATRPDRAAPFGAAARIGAINGHVEAPTVSPDGCAILFHALVEGRFRLSRAARSDCVRR